MKTREQILNAIKDGKTSQAIDGRDFDRLTDYFPVSDWVAFGCTLREGEDAPQPKDLTAENVIESLRGDVEFGFEKALNQRGLSALSMNAVVLMWLWVLDDPLMPHDDYAQYGLPLLKAVAVKYGFYNPIGDDNGDEDKYAA